MKLGKDLLNSGIGGPDTKKEQKVDYLPTSRNPYESQV